MVESSNVLEYWQWRWVPSKPKCTWEKKWDDQWQLKPEGTNHEIDLTWCKSMY